MKIGNFEFKNGIFLAPMAGVTDVGFRSIARFFGAELTTTEMVSAKGLVFGQYKGQNSCLNPSFVDGNKNFANNKSAWLLLCEQNEKIKCAQLFGNDPEFFARAISLPCMEDFDLIDINMGCPAPKIIKNGEGSALMENLEKAKSVIEACVSSGKPVTVKFRAGLKNENYLEFGNMCEKAGASAVILHPRLASQGYAGSANYELLKTLKREIAIPIVGSGDVRTTSDLEKILETGVDGVMIGRASWGNPVIFKTMVEFKEKREKEPLSKFVLKDNFFDDVLTKEDLNLLEQNENYIKFICAKKHVKILRKYFSETFLIPYMRKHMLWYAGGIRADAKLKRELALSNNLDQSLGILKQILTM